MLDYIEHMIQGDYILESCNTCCEQGMAHIYVQTNFSI